MKSHRNLSVFLFCGSLCLFAGLHKSSWAATPPAPAQRSASESAAPPQSSSPDSSLPSEEVAIPGPLRSFLRMAAISQKITPEEVLPLLARNVVMSGYQAGKPTEFLVLVNWYMDQARELEALAGKGEVIHVSNCDDAKQLLVILGYRLAAGLRAGRSPRDRRREQGVSDHRFRIPIGRPRAGACAMASRLTLLMPLQKFPSSTSLRIGCRTRKMPTAELWTRSCAIPIWPACIGRCPAWIPKRVNSCGNPWDRRN